MRDRLRSQRSQTLITKKNQGKVMERASRAWQLRHNSIVARIKNAVSPKCDILGENRDISGSGLRPDLFIKHKQDYYLVEVTVPFDNRCAALHIAHQRKVDKYEPVLEVLKSQGINATIIPFVVGALGSWYPPK
ncbi:uncharacterized protein CEXT_352191 [Caerostris extrusa]|uniref:Uncharacterized protein n=1 Tax=Caerostris extrusa TaxID=172846 RepID=A0AAV4WIL4_CAEEX|nr:uncharacterized protein CEXT_352191 [Caerostris extrusa]